uniref:Ig-like domain-containing protein n=1 Tax=Ficedula albicollis TaxID=59894 RepID=A0A803V273_FICAL
MSLPCCPQPRGGPGRLSGAQSTQILVEPPWTPAVCAIGLLLVSLGPSRAVDTPPRCPRCRGHTLRTCLGLLSVTGPSCPTEPLVLQVPARALLEGDGGGGRVRVYKDEKELGESLRGTVLSLSLLELPNSGHYRCSGLRVTVPTSISFPDLFPALSPLNLSCLSTPSPLRPRAPLLYRFYRDGQLVGGPQGSPQLLVPAVGVSHSGNYSCEVRSEGGAVRKSSARLGVTVRTHPCSAICVPLCLPSSLPGYFHHPRWFLHPSPGLHSSPWIHLSLAEVPPLSMAPPSLSAFPKSSLWFS